MSVEYDETQGRLDRLSARERQVLEMASRGMTNGQVARDLCVSVHAVKFHLGGVYRKLGVANRTQATMLLYRYGYGRSVHDGQTSDETVA
jgi:DNA-binding CsgD family transcriptional regulator